MSVASAVAMSEDEYLEAERTAKERHEFVAGQCWAMSGGTHEHAVIQANLLRELGNALRDRPCFVHSGDMRLKSELTGLYTYPDASITCDPPRFLDSRRDTLLNPTAVFEVLSDSTEAYDRGKKFDHYRRIPSVCHYVLVSQHEVQIEHRRRLPDGSWSLHIVGPGEELEVVGCRLVVDEVYLKVLFEGAPPTS